MYFLTLLLAIACFIGAFGGASKGWPWWACVLLGLGGIFFFLAEPSEDD